MCENNTKKYIFYTEKSKPFILNKIKEFEKQKSNFQ